MSKDLSTQEKEILEQLEKALPGPINDPNTVRCDICGQVIPQEREVGYYLSGPTALVLRDYCSAKCLAKDMHPVLVKMLADRVAKELKQNRLQ